MRLKNQQPENRENLEILSFSASNLLSLITDILDFSKIDAGKIEFARAEFDLQHLLNGTNHSFKSRCEEKQVHLQLNIDKNIPPVIIGDELRLAQVLNNLLGNAVKFTSAGQIILHAGYETINPRKIRLKFEVKDTGIGIKKEKLEHIFDEFVQADARIVKDFGGSGLGLSITRKLIQLQGGDIHVSSRFGKGTSFTFFIDYEVSDKQQLQRKYEVVKQTEKVFHPGLRILLVEDNLANQKVAVSYFEHWGLNADVANNGVEALQCLREHPYDLVLTDLFMPVMDGFETITKIRQQLKRKALPIIALTASAETKLIDRALKAGANRCLTKPFNPKELQQTLIELLHQNNEPKPNQVQMRVVSSSYTPEMKLKHINLKRIEEASLGKPAFVREMLQICKSEIPQTLQQAQHYFNDANYTHFAKSIHKLKNTLLMIGLDEWSTHLQFMESSALAETQLSMVKLFLDELMVTGQEVVEELEQVIPTV
jgi:CheY-like chemotaxis protein/HPt (histidine-containing phosphotransfer) domain-containing protein